MHAHLHNQHDRENGFTLVELLIVVLIIGILAAIAIPVYLGVQNQAHKTGLKADVNNTVKRVQVAMVEGIAIASIKSSNTGYVQNSEGSVKGETVTITDSAALPTTNQFNVNGTLATATGASIDYTYQYDSATGKFTETDGNGDVVLGGGSSTSPTTNANGAAFYTAPSTYTAVNTIAAANTTWTVRPVADTSGNIYYSVNSGTKIYKYNATTGTATVFAGSGSANITDGTGAAASFLRIQDMAIDASDNLYAADYNTGTSTYTMRKITPTGTVTTLFAYTNANIQYARMILASDGGFYLGTYEGLYIVKLSGTGTNPTVVLNKTGTNLKPYAIYADANDTLYFASYSDPNASVNGGVPAVAYQVVNPTTITPIGTAPTGAQAFGIVGDSAGNLYVGYSAKNIIVKIAANAAASVTPLTVAGTSGSSGSTDGAATTTARLGYVNNMSMGPGGKIYFWNTSSAGSVRVLS